MGLYHRELDDSAVEEKAVELCQAEGVDPFILMWEAGEPLGEVWSNYIGAAVVALSKS